MTCQECKGCKTWSRIFMAIGTLSVVTACIQSSVQIFALRLSVQFEDIPYIWLFILCTWITLIYFAYSLRLLYLVRCRRCSEISKVWWYFAVIIMILNPSLSVFWWINGDVLLYSVSLPASFVYVLFFILVCRTITPHKEKCSVERISANNDSSIPLQTLELRENV